MTTPVIKMPVGRANLEIHNGASFIPTLLVTDDAGAPIDYSAYSGSLIFWQSTSSTTPIMEFTTLAGKITLGNGIIQFLITAADTAALTFDRAFYQLKLVAPSTAVYHFLEGIATVLPK